MPRVKGEVERVACKEKDTKYGTRYAIGIVVKDEWYNTLSKKDADDLGLEEGVAVTFSYADNDYGHQINGKTLKVAEGQGRETKAPVKSNSKAPAKASSHTVGNACGHAVTNAVQLAIAAGDTSNKAIYGRAVDILAISTHLQGRYDKIVQAAKDGETEKLKPNAPAAEEEGEEEAPKKKAPPKRKAPAKKKPEPEPEPEEEEEEAEPEEGEEEDVDFDDDIPFS